jgi:hypothetical protein
VTERAYTDKEAFKPASRPSPSPSLKVSVFVARLITDSVRVQQQMLNFPSLLSEMMDAFDVIVMMVLTGIQMPFVKKIKSDAYFSRFQVKYRRRREGKTDCECSVNFLWARNSVCHP